MPAEPSRPEQRSSDFQHQPLLLLLVVSLFALVGQRAFATEAGSKSGGPPEWINAQSRTVQGGDILHLGVGIGKSPEIARFKAESMAVKNLMSECSLAHREIVIWDRYLEKADENSYKAYARAGLSFTACDEARAAKGEDRKRLSNPVLVRNQDLYDQLERESVDQSKLLGRIQAWTRALVGKSEDRLNELESRITELEKSPSQSVTVIHQNTILVGATANKEGRLRDCMEEYQQLMREAQDRAMASTPPGNLASPEAAPAWNRAQRKLFYCRKIKQE